MNTRHLSLTLAVALGLASPSLSAMGLGPLQVKSGLNQPLVAEIPIISATPSELEQLDVRLASPEAFARIGLERPGELTANLQFSVGENSRGQPVILVTTPDRFSEPLLNFLIEAEWGKGTVTREYTALIDPPYIASAVVKPMQAPSVAPPVAAASVVSAPVVEPALEPVPEPTPMPAQAPEVVQEAPPPAPEPASAPYVAPVPVAAEPEPLPPPAPRPEAAKPRPVAAQPRPAQPAPAPLPVAPEPEATPTPGQYGPVAPGQTLWSIANSVRPDASISVNQMMVALLRANPESFAQENVNRLKQGSVLRVPGQEEATRLSATQAAELVNQQASAWRTPRAAVPQPVEIATPSENTNAKPPIAASPARPSRAASSRLEIVPPSGNAAARGTQSGAAAGAGGTELRAELVQAREDLAARTTEVDELKSRVAELEKQDADRQRLIDMQNSRLKDLQDRLNQIQQAQAPAPATPAAASTTAAATIAPAATAAAPAKPWYLNPLAVGGAVLLLLGGLVLAMRRSKAKPESETTGTRLSDDEALRASMAKTRLASEPIRSEPIIAAVPAAAPVDSELDACVNAVRAKPQDLEAHLNLLRLQHSRGNAVDYEVAAQAMRAQLSSTMDPRWREAVVMGASLMPGHALFSQAGWNSPRYSDAEPKVPPTPAPSPVPAAALPSFLASAEPAPVKVFEPPIEDSSLEFTTGSPRDANPDKEIDFGDQAAVMDETFGGPLRDIHRDEAQLMAEDESSATRIELAKAYLDIGDLDGARSMLEEVLAEGGPTAKAEAARLLKDMG